MRSGVYPEHVLVLWAAKRLGRPVKWTSDRREGFVSDEHGRDNASTAELALDENGTFLALRVAITLNIGAYLTPRSAGPGTNNVGGLAGVYATPAIHVQTTGVYSNMTPTGPYRGAGRPEATYAIERVIDLAARDAGSIRWSSDAATSSRPRRCRSRRGSSSRTTAAISRAAWRWRSRLRITRVSGSGAPRLGSGASFAVSASRTQSRSRAAPIPPSIRICRSTRQSRRLDHALHRFHVDGTGERDGVHPDRERPARRSACASRCSRVTPTRSTPAAATEAPARSAWAAPRSRARWIEPSSAGASSSRICSKRRPTTSCSATAGSRWPGPTVE